MSGRRVKERPRSQYNALGFRKLDLRTEDPLRGAYGLSWYERKPSSLSQEEWTRLDRAVKTGAVSLYEYFDWKENVR